MMTINHKRMMVSWRGMLTVALPVLILNGCSEWSGAPQHETPLSRSEIRKRDFGNVMGDDFLLFGARKAASATSGGYSSAGSNVNPYLWRATLDTLTFAPLSSADAVGGVIVTDWYISEAKPNERVKLTVVITDRALRADALKVTIHKQRLSGTAWLAQPSDGSAQSAMEDIILSKARELRVAALGNKQ